MKYVVIGGGIAGTCCTEELCRVVRPDDTVLLISAAPVLKVTYTRQPGKHGESLRDDLASF